jgi:hypothetical protein
MHSMRMHRLLVTLRLALMERAFQRRQLVSDFEADRAEMRGHVIDPERTLASSAILAQRVCSQNHERS